MRSLVNLITGSFGAGDRGTAGPEEPQPGGSLRFRVLVCRHSAVSAGRARSSTGTPSRSLSPRHSLPIDLHRICASFVAGDASVLTSGRASFRSSGDLNPFRTRPGSAPNYASHKHINFESFPWRLTADSLPRETAKLHSWRFVRARSPNN